MKRNKDIDCVDYWDLKSDNNSRKYYNGELYTGIAINMYYYPHEHDDDFVPDYDPEQIYEFTTYKNGKKNGLEKHWYKNGKLLDEAFREPFFETKWSTIKYYKSFYENGENKMLIDIDNEIITITKWFDNGNLKEKSTCKKGISPIMERRIDDDFIKVGSYKLWNKNGTLINEIDFDSHLKLNDFEIENILLKISSNDPFYKIVLKRSDSMLNASEVLDESVKHNISKKKNFMMGQIKYWIDAHYEEYIVSKNDKNSSILKFNEYLRIYKHVNSFIKSFNLTKDCTINQKKLVYLHMSSYCSFESIKKYIQKYNRKYDWGFDPTKLNIENILIENNYGETP
jgi:antitoxin component YwqK of YwqJK toxin-antitoxin module